MQRLQKVLAQAGIASRRKTEEMISAGEVTINGRVARLGDSASPGDTILVRGRPLHAEPRLYVALNKPVGYVSTTGSGQGDPPVMELVDVPQRVFPVGRLDRNTSGLLLLSNDGDWANLITHPRYGIEKEYVAVVEGTPNPAVLRALRDGVALPDGSVSSPGRVEVLSRQARLTDLSITIAEGKKRQLRLMAAAVGHPVVSLKRVRIGPIMLNGLPSGEWRKLNTEEVKGIEQVPRLDTATRAQGTGADRH
ncbi:MAG: pseudouridine synthase [Chloroflexota bacterium]